MYIKRIMGQAIALPCRSQNEPSMCLTSLSYNVGAMKADILISINPQRRVQRLTWTMPRKRFFQIEVMADVSAEPQG